MNVLRKRLRCVDEPLAVGFVVEEGKEGLAHAGMIIIKVLDFVGCHEFTDDGTCVDGAEGEGFEAEPRPFPLESWGVHYQHRVLCPNAVTACDVNTRFDGDGHSSLQGSGHPVHAELMRPLVNAEVAAYAMPRTVAVVLMLLPHCVTGEDIKLGACGALREDGGGQTDVTFQDEGVVTTLVVR